jgi:hypothetical protein
LKEWFNNRTRGTSKASGPSVINLSIKAARKKTEVQMYSHTYYAERCKATVDRCWEAECKKQETWVPGSKIPTVPVTFINRVVEELYKSETAETVQIVKEKVAAQDQPENEEEDSGEEALAACLQTLQR